MITNILQDIPHKIVQLPAKAILLDAGNIATDIFFVKTGCLLLAVLACREPFMGVFFKFAAFLAKDPVTLSPAAVQLYHHGYCMLLSFYSASHL